MPESYFLLPYCTVVAIALREIDPPNVMHVRTYTNLWFYHNGTIYFIGYTVMQVPYRQ